MLQKLVQIGLNKVGNGRSLQALFVVSTVIGASAPLAEAAIKDEIIIQAGHARRHLTTNLRHPRSKLGAIIASPSGGEPGQPNYLYHWVRDAALAMRPVFEDANGFRTFARAWVSFESGLQVLPAQGGLGEPKYYPDGRVWNEPWGRPQNDGPALRAITAIRLARQFMALGDHAYVRRELYDARLPAQTLIKRDLEYTSHHWSQPAYDLWEEVKGDHFYTRVVQQAALLEGAALAQDLGNRAAAEHYRREAGKIGETLNRHWDSKGYFQITRNRVEGWDHKHSGLDVAVILGVIHAYGEYSPWKATDVRVLSTAMKLEDDFRARYPINRDSSVGLAIGRYPEDVYDGVGFGGGNPWFITTHGMAEFYCRGAAELKGMSEIRLSSQSASLYNKMFAELRMRPAETIRAGTLSMASPLGQQLIEAHVKKAGAYFDRVLKHRGPEGRMSEQFRRDNGFMQGARDLSWSYASFLSAVDVCEPVMQNAGGNSPHRGR